MWENFNYFNSSKSSHYKYGKRKMQNNIGQSHKYISIGPANPRNNFIDM